MRKTKEELLLIKLAMKVAKASDKNLKRICELAMYWDNDVMYIILNHYGLEQPPSEWKEIPSWKKRVFSKLRHLAK